MILLPSFSDLSRQALEARSCQISLGFIGDSWIRGSGLPGLGDARRERYFMPRLTAALQQYYGDAGGGWCGLSFPNSDKRRGGSADSNRLYQSGEGHWETHKNDRPVPDICTAVSRHAGDTIRITLVQGPTRSVKLHFLAGGAIEYRWNGGNWNALDLSHENAACPVELKAFPPHGAWKLDLRVVHGTVELAGIVHDSGQPGLVVHNLGAGGSSTQHWGAVDAGTWIGMMAHLRLDAALTLFGTNDQKLIEPDEHEQYLESVLGRLRQAAPRVDLALVTSPESGDTTPPRLDRPMQHYSIADKALADRLAATHLALQDVFGDVEQYRYGGPKPLLDTSLIHPSAAGMVLLEAFFFTALTGRPFPA